MPTIDEMVNLITILGSAIKTPEIPVKELKQGEVPTEPQNEQPIRKKDEKGGPSDLEPVGENPTIEPSKPLVLLNEEDAIYDVNAIPLYFPMSYSLVKPYVRGFEMNGLDASSLTDVSIDSNWQPKP